MKITQLKRLNDRTVQCVVEDRGRLINVDVNLLTDGEIRGFQLSGISSDDEWQLSNCSASIDLSRHIWKCFDGEIVSLPIELHAFQEVGA